MERYICIHGHFYQPSRANPWLDFIELQEDAYPYHDWNEKINEECYMVNGGSHILNSQKKIIRLINNYSKISFNFGPLLLSWIRQNDADTYKNILRADILSAERFNGHGSAIAQVYNHVIMPLAGRRYKYIQALWAVRDFEANFKRKPEGMWLSETAVDYETLEILAGLGISFTILSPDQASAIRYLKKPDSISGGSYENPQENLPDSNRWADVSDGSINTRMPYLCRLPGGNSINIFFYDKKISNRLSFGNLLEDSRLLVRELINAPSVSQDIPEIICIASDGETYGHHHKFGDMALAFALETIESDKTVQQTVFGDYLAKFKPVYEVQIKENSSWSCGHGTCRWKEDCGCSAGSSHHAGWNQKWREPLRRAIDWLSAKAVTVYENEMKKYIREDVPDAWEAIYNYIITVSNPAEENIRTFLQAYLKDGTSKDEYSGYAVTVLKILEMYRNAMLMQSSDGWFFDDISRPEAIQVMVHACRVMEIIKELTLEDSEEYFTSILKEAKSNISRFADGKSIYDSFAKAASYDYEKITAHFVFDLLFDRKQEELFSYGIDILSIEKKTEGDCLRLTGSVQISSKATLETEVINFSGYLFKNRNILSDEGAAVFTGLKQAGSIPSRKFILKDLLKDRQVELSEELIISKTEKINPVISGLFEEYENTVREFSGKKILDYFLDGIFPGIHKFIGEIMIYHILRKKGLSKDDIVSLKNILAGIEHAPLKNSNAFSSLATKKFNGAVKLFSKDSENIRALKTIVDFFVLLEKAGLTPNTWKSQNRIFEMKQNKYPDMKKKTDALSVEWTGYFEILLEKLAINY
ncbi:MAG: DUF3536 domain-containing protein [Actinobacteria bacterium]|nr:DUF3536 domain-containing protein [Actinomycetota bacterium]